MIELKSVGILRCATVFAVLAAIGGLVEGVILGSIATMTPSNGPNPMPEAIRPLLGVGAVIFMPIFFAIAGFIEGMIGAFLYNVVARWTGGLQFTVVTAPVQTDSSLI